MKKHFMLVTLDRRLFNYLPKKDLSGDEQLFHHRMEHRIKKPDQQIEYALKDAVIISGGNLEKLKEKMSAFQAKGYGASLISEPQLQQFQTMLSGGIPETGVRRLQPVFDTAQKQDVAAAPDNTITTTPPRHKLH